MLNIDVDYQPSFQQIAFVDRDTGGCVELRLSHSYREGERFYRKINQRRVSERVRRSPPTTDAGSSDEKRERDPKDLARVSSFNVIAFRTGESGSPQ
jgi:hypothetical protein